MARRTKRQIMSGVDSVKARIVDHNTVEYHRENGERVIRLHLTDIVTYTKKGKVILNTGGWETVTTKDRINKQLEANCAGWRVWSEKRVLYLSYGYWNADNHKVFHFHDGIIIDPSEVDPELACDGEVFDKSKVKRINAYHRKVKKYAKDFIQAMRDGEVPAPGAGDCWFCSFVSTDGQAWGEMGKQDHIYNHIVEKYYVPSLLMRAIKLHPVAPVAEWCMAAMWGEQTEQAIEYRDSAMSGIGWDQLEKSLYRYVLHYAPYVEGMIEAVEAQIKEAS